MDDPTQQPESKEPGTFAPKGLLYHYTTIDGFIGIVDSDNLRATHIRYLNDSKEFVDVLDHLDGLMDGFGESIRKINEPEQIVRPRLKKLLQSLIDPFSGKNGVFVISFTDDEGQLAASHQMPGDRLSQWRAYSAGGKGISLGFDYKALRGSGNDNVWSIQGCMAYLLNCLYRAHDKRLAFQRAGESLFKRQMQLREEFAVSQSARNPELRPAERLSGRGGPPANPAQRAFAEDLQERLAQEFGRSLVQELLLSATTFKNPAYFEEKEWRIVILMRNGERSEDCPASSPYLPVRFRNGALGLTPFVECPLGLRTYASPLRRIVVGPTPHMEEAVKGVAMFLEHKGIRLKGEDFPDGVEVVGSSVPYRNW